MDRRDFLNKVAVGAGAVGLVGATELTEAAEPNIVDGPGMSMEELQALANTFAEVIRAEMAKMHLDAWSRDARSVSSMNIQAVISDMKMGWGGVYVLNDGSVEVRCSNKIESVASLVPPTAWNSMSHARVSEDSGMFVLNRKGAVITAQCSLCASSEQLDAYTALLVGGGALLLYMVDSDGSQRPMGRISGGIISSNRYYGKERTEFLLHVHDCSEADLEPWVVSQLALDDVEMKLVESLRFAKLEAGT